MVIGAGAGHVAGNGPDGIADELVVGPIDAGLGPWAGGLLAGGEQLVGEGWDAGRAVGGSGHWRPRVGRWCGNTHDATADADAPTPLLFHQNTEKHTRPPSRNRVILLNDNRNVRS
jgi:hypothetical protein